MSWYYANTRRFNTSNNQPNVCLNIDCVLLLTPISRTMFNVKCLTFYKPETVKCCLR